MTEPKKTVLHPQHKELQAKLVPFGGWEMPLNYPTGIVEEHQATRRHAGLFDVSHMGRFVIKGKNACAFLQHTLTSNAASLDLNESHYTIIPNERGGAIDDAFLYRFFPDEYLLVVNAANREKDWRHFQEQKRNFDDVELLDKSEALAMLALQGPESKRILEELLDAESALPEPLRNRLSIAEIMLDNDPEKRCDLLISRTGYTGEPLCFEFFIERSHAASLWNTLIHSGAVPVGLGARDTLRLEAGLPLYGHEFGTDPEGNEIPILACPLTSIAVSFSPLKKSFIGNEPLRKQFEAHKRYKLGDFSDTVDLPRRIKPVAVAGRGVVRRGSKVFAGEKPVGQVTSGTMVPYWKWQGVGLESSMQEEKGMRSICLALIDSELTDETPLMVEVRNRRVEAYVVPYHLRVEAPPYARPILYDHLFQTAPPAAKAGSKEGEALSLLEKAFRNTKWRQTETINLIPSEQTPSPLVRLISVMDPCCRYAEHKQIKAFEDAEIFFYQGTDFIGEVEKLLEEEMRRYFGCSEVETRPISGQMANAAFFSAMIDYRNIGDRKHEQERMRCVMNHHIIKGGHLSAQPMGALRDFVRRDPRTEKPAVVNFPMLADRPLAIDIAASKELIEEYRPELVIFGRSMTIYREPVAPISAFIKEQGLDTIVMYDMAHVLGLYGPHFQEPFTEGADIVTGSTHKTFFGTQRGVISCNMEPQDLRYDLWEAIRRRTFPGSVSNHHLGTQLGQLLAAYEMNTFKDAYQKQVIANAKAFAGALSAYGLEVAGDPELSYTETHQVLVHVGFCRGSDAARQLEENNIIVNFQAGPEEESFSASGYLRLGVAEMTRFGMKEEDFKELASLIRDVIVEKKDRRKEVTAFRSRFLELQYCFTGDAFTEFIEKLKSWF